MSDPSLVSQVVPSVVGGVIGGGFALAGGIFAANRTARHERRRVERDELLRLSAEMIRGSDAMWVEDVSYRRALFSQINAERSSHSSLEYVQALREKTKAAQSLYIAANDSLRSRAAEMRLRQPSLAETAITLWKASRVHGKASDDDAWDPDDKPRRDAESTFIAKVRARMDELD